MIILATCGNGYAGCDAEEVFFYDEGTAEAIINEDVWQWACDNGESYAYVHFGWDEDYTDEDYDNYIENYTILKDVANRGLKSKEFVVGN